MTGDALARTLASILGRDLDAARREVEAYPEAQLLWAAVPGLSNSGGVLVRHLCGNLQHFIGATLGGSGYVRNREAEFGGPPDSRESLLEEIARTKTSTMETLAGLTRAQLEAEYPLPLGDHRLQTERFLVHLAVHFGFHLGQLDYHRRAVTGVGTSVSPVNIGALVQS